MIGASSKWRENRCGSIVAEVMIDLEVGPARQQLLHVRQQEVDVQAALVRLVDDEGVVAPQLAVALDLGEQDAVGHQPDRGVLAGVVTEPHPVADRPAQRNRELLGDPLGHRTGSDPPRLGVTDGAAHPAAQLEAHLGDLRRLARPGLTGNDHHLVVADRRHDLVPGLAHRQGRRIADGRHGSQPPGDALLRPYQLGRRRRRGTSRAWRRPWSDRLRRAGRPTCARPTGSAARAGPAGRCPSLPAYGSRTAAGRMTPPAIGPMIDLHRPSADRELVTALLTIAVLLIAYSAVSAPLDRWGVTSAIVFVTAGFLVGSRGIGWLDIPIQNAVAERDHRARLGVAAVQRRVQAEPADVAQPPGLAEPAAADRAAAHDGARLRRGAAHPARHRLRPAPSC